MLKIQVLGQGLIPRGHGIAPKKEPFPADLTLIGLILGTPGLKMNYINPETNQLAPLTRDNYQKVYAKYPNGTAVKAVVKQAEEDQAPTTPVAPTPKEVTVAPIQEEQVAPPEQTEADTKVETDKPAEFTMKPIMTPDEKPRNQQQQQNTNRNHQNGQRR